MDAGGAWERLLHTPTTWIVVAVVLFVVAVVLLLAGARAGRTARAQRAPAPAAPGAAGVGTAATDDDPVTEPSVPRRDVAPAEGAVGKEPVAEDAVGQDAVAADPVGEQDVEEDPVTEPAAPRAAAVPDHPDASDASDASVAEPLPDRPDESATQRLLGVLVDDPAGAVAGAAALERGEEPGRAAVTLLRSGVPAPAVARLCGVSADDLGDLVAAALGVLPDQAELAALRAPEQRVSL